MTRSPAPRPRSVRCVARAHFHLAQHPDAETVYVQLLGLVEDVTPRFQPHPHDHAADLELTGTLAYFRRPPTEVAQILQLRAAALHGVHASVGIGPNVMLAAMAVGRTAPGHVTLVESTAPAIAAFLRPQPVAALPGIGPATTKSLARFGITTIGQLADAPEPALARLLGAHAARTLTTRARGVNERPVQRTTLIRSTGASHRFDRDELNPHAHRRALRGLAEDLGQRLRTADEVCRALTLTARYADGSTTTRTRTLPEATNHSPALARTSTDLYESFALQRARVTQLSLRAEQLGPAEHAHHQLLLDTSDDKAHRIEAAADRARARFGPHAIRPAVLATPPRH
ncbi:hypothetical protein ACFVY1_25670 [Streptomyces sp. NPDC058293]|uniref:DNA polymerase Y family protein n=1 Tax=Streptomyces sp. NPDC058293 TaxID=3346429 RepID=UPI0036E68B5B